MNRSLICLVLMLTIAPIVACSTVVWLEPSRWGGSINPITIIVMALFGLITVPLWPTFIPALIITPLLMKKVAKSQFFKTACFPVLIGISLPVGAIAGAVVLVPMILMSQEDPKLAVNWAIAGALAGSITLSVIATVYYRDRGDRVPPFLSELDTPTNSTDGANEK